MRLATILLVGLSALANVTLAQANQEGHGMNLELNASVNAAIWPEREMKDVVIDLTLRNASTKPFTLYPTFTALSWLTSVASMGMTWNLAFVSATPGGSATARELRTYYGPPGEPVTREAVRKAGVVLKPGKERKTTLKAVWLPNALLGPGSLAAGILDPEGFDNLKAVPNLEGSSVLVLNASAKQLGADLGKRKDLLRGHMVVFFAAPGKYSLQATYRQQPLMCPFVEEVSAVAKPVELTIGAPAGLPSRTP
jgi:hypothetical protein